MKNKLPSERHYVAITLTLPPWCWHHLDVVNILICHHAIIWYCQYSTLMLQYLFDNFDALSVSITLVSPSHHLMSISWYCHRFYMNNTLMLSTSWFCQHLDMSSCHYLILPIQYFDVAIFVRYFGRLECFHHLDIAIPSLNVDILILPWLICDQYLDVVNILILSTSWYATMTLFDIANTVPWCCNICLIFSTPTGFPSPWYRHHLT